MRPPMMPGITSWIWSDHDESAKGRAGSTSELTATTMSAREPRASRDLTWGRQLATRRDATRGA